MPTVKAPKISSDMRGTLIRSGGSIKGAVSNGYQTQLISRVSPHNSNKRFLVPNRFRIKADV